MMATPAKLHEMCKKCWTRHYRNGKRHVACEPVPSDRFAPGQMAYMLNRAALMRAKDEANYGSAS
jgi:hypothetical protein